MGGFCGFTETNKNHDKNIINSMLETISHRNLEDVEIAFHKNIVLSFVKSGKHSFTDKFQTAFTGDIYNAPELQTMLEEKGHIFDTFSVIDILLRLYEEYGTGMLTYLRGSFAFLLYDIENNKVFCARDPFGIKPFYYTIAEGEFIFGSEIKAFLHHPGFKPEVNTEALGQYMTFQYSVLNETFFKGVFKLPQGHYLIWENNDIQITRYHNYMFTPEKISLDNAAENIDQAVCESVKKHMVSSHEIGTFLSGGVDSGYMATLFSKFSENTEAATLLPEGSESEIDSCCSNEAWGSAPLAKKRAFTVGFEYEKYNEIEYAKSLADKLGLTHITKIISTQEYWDSLPKIQYFMDEPLADPAAVAFYFACREAAQHVKIAFSGEGADEFFGGYNIYKEPISLQFYAKLPLPLRKWLANIAKRLPRGVRGRSFIIRGAKSVEERFIGNAFIFTEEERDKLLKHPVIQSPTDITRPYYDLVKNQDDITKMQFLDINLWLEGDILLQADKMSMAHGLQLRTPLLDLEVAKVASRLPVEHRVSKRMTKIAFRKAASKHLPPETAERYKLGFPIPTRIWLKEEKYYNMVKIEFTSDIAEKYFHVDELVNLLDEHYTGKSDNSRKIWTVYMFLLWHNEFFPKEMS